jgi:uncharacterized Rmd1/YagE family protein
MVGAETPLEKSGFRARALLLGERIDLRALEATERLAASPLTVSVSGGGVAVLFRYGVLVLFDVAPMEEAAFLNGLKPLITGALERPETESLEVRIDASGQEGITGNTVVLLDPGVPRLQVVADVLAKSVILAYYETKVSRSFDRIEPFAQSLERKGSGARQGKALLRMLGGALLSEERMVGRVEVGDKPEILWSRPDLEGLYVRLEKEFEIRERHVVVDRKLELISRTAQTVLELLQNNRTLRVEWYIVILIVVEILLSLYAMFFRGH